MYLALELPNIDRTTEVKAMSVYDLVESSTVIFEMEYDKDKPAFEVVLDKHSVAQLHAFLSVFLKDTQTPKP